jgi:hypothetical protein
MGILRHCSWFIIAVRRFFKSFISIHIVYICYHLTMFIVTLLLGQDSFICLWFAYNMWRVEVIISNRLNLWALPKTALHCAYFTIIMYLRNIYCCRRQIPNWHRQISQYNTVISIVIQDKTTFNWTKQNLFSTELKNGSVRRP